MELAHIHCGFTFLGAPDSCIWGYNFAMYGQRRADGVPLEQHWQEIEREPADATSGTCAKGPWEDD